ncbi:MAG: helix-hairpin-helix domain-containing protein [Gammaproteobacteria bacterium]|nr:helix-hairpin-helix domain-containing protein [Gammaproteobacteria bacterium]MDF1588748.1 helix-hairpin-helix domain-containing protein [Gammaproteobacteria bacterium]
MFKKLFLAFALAFALSTGAAMAADKIDINTATKTELQSLNGVGDATAEAIIEYRTQNGPFLRVSDLEKVKGIGQKKAEKLAESVTVSKAE